MIVDSYKKVKKVLWTILVYNFIVSFTENNNRYFD